jgi:large subunit ribosomal protein L18
MNRLALKSQNASRRSHRVRSQVIGVKDRPRLSVNISNLHISAQIIDDGSGKTLAYASTVGKDISGNMTERAAAIGKEIATKAKKAKLGKVAFDRGRRKYHGRMKALADAARKEGLEF